MNNKIAQSDLDQQKKKIQWSCVEIGMALMCMTKNPVVC